MKIGKNCSFWELYHEHGIRIPQIQRDYVQGRENPRIRENRKSFVKEIVSSIVNDTPFSLNFIYGYYDENRFVPIDGQQRLTTLFLLHYYVFTKANETNKLFTNGKLRFSYETRYTTNRFLNDLCIHKELSKDNIINSSWFSYSWNYDPSVISFLTMINEIENAFKDYDDWETYIHRLIIDCPIRFMLLEMEKDQLGKPNQLYIRMNSRGKQLTDFENFKASLYGFVEESNNEELKDLKNNISSSVDGDWQELIWNIQCNSAIAEKYSDIFYRDLLHWIFINTACIGDIFYNDDRVNWLKPNDEAIDISTTYLENYIDLINEYYMESNNEVANLNHSDSDQDRVSFIYNFFKKYLEDILYTFSTFCNIKDTNLINKVLNYSENKKYYSTNISAYKSRVFLFAITVYGRNNTNIFDENSFKAWFRLVSNLVNNTPIDDPDAFKKACAAVYSFNGSLEDWLSDEKTISGFSSRQIEEELFKLSVMKQPNWKQAILRAEENEYFQGEILFSFFFVGIKTTTDATPDKATVFEQIWNSIDELIDFAKENDNMFHRALLTYGDYSVQAPGGIGKYGVHTFFQYSERHHNYDWRGMLRPYDGNLSNGARLFLLFLNDCKLKPAKDVAKRLISTYKINDDNTSLWEQVRYDLVKTEELFQYCSNYYYIWHDIGDICEEENWHNISGESWNRYCLMKTSKRNTFMEARSYCKYHNFEGKNKKYHEGKNPWDEEERRSWVILNGETIEYKKHND